MIKKKKKILLQAINGKNWIGGLYYVKNVLYSLLLNEYISSKYELVLFVDDEKRDVFKAFEKQVTFLSAPNNQLFKKIKLFCYVYTHRVSVVFPTNRKMPFVLCVSWIPDFQHLRLPQFFSEEELQKRSNEHVKLLKKPNPLIVSSYDSLNDLKTFYKVNNKKIYVLHFVSFLEDVISTIDCELEKNIMTKYSLRKNSYFVVMNQFWQHKNHLIVFEAIEKFFEKNPNSTALFVFSGEMSDYRNPEYIQKLKIIAEKQEIKKHIMMLGFLDRTEQVIVMKNSRLVIQPSLFEGWGTVLEDAKVLDKTVLLSDIPVHREQRNGKCCFFDPYNVDELCCLLEKAMGELTNESLTFSISDTRNRAKDYSSTFEMLLKDNDL